MAKARHSKSSKESLCGKIPVSQLKLNDRNPRTITEQAFDRLCKSIKRDPEFMVLRPIVVDGDGVILGGNQRYRACLHMGMTELPAAWVVKVSSLTAAQRKRFMILDNSPDGISGDWDYDILGADYEIPDLADVGLDVDFDHEEGDKSGEAVPLGESSSKAEVEVLRCPKCGFAFEVRK